MPANEIEDTLFLAVIAAEGLHGQARVRLDATYSFDPDRRTCVIDAGTDVGRDICRIFGGLAIREFGESAFAVRHAAGDPEAEPEGLPV